MNWKPVAVIVTTVLACADAQAQTDPTGFGEHLTDSVMLQSGAEDPTAVSRAIAVAALPGSLSGLRLEPTDRLVLEQWAGEVSELQQEGRARVESYVHDFCDQLQSGVRDVASGLQELSRLATESEGAVLASFEEATTRLSAAGRLTVNDYIDNVLIPGTAVLRIDFDRLFRETSSEAVTAHLQAQCDFRAAYSEQEIVEMMREAAQATPGALDSSEARSSSPGQGTQQQLSGTELELDSNM